MENVQIKRLLATSWKLVVILIVSCLSTSALAQVDGNKDTTDKQLMLVTKTDGGQFYGYILSDDGREILLMTKTIGKIYISKADIASIVKVSDTESKKIESGAYSDYRNEGPFTTRYYLTTNALPIKKKENYAMIHLYGPEVHFAVSDNLSIGVMSSWIASPIAVATKYAFNSKSDNHFALGTIVGSSGFLFNASGAGGLHFGTFTKGDRKANMSISAGYGWTILGSDLRRSYDYKYDVRGEYHYDRSSTNALAQFNGFSISEVLDKPFTGAGVFGISGITPVGKKASFIFDGMAVLTPNYKRSVSQTYKVDGVTYTDHNGNIVVKDYLIDEYELTPDGIKPTILIMPGMRFNQSHNKAFQIVLAGVITTNSIGKIITFPVPMVSWLRTF